MDVPQTSTRLGWLPSPSLLRLFVLHGQTRPSPGRGGRCWCICLYAPLLLASVYWCGKVPLGWSSLHTVSAISILLYSILNDVIYRPCRCQLRGAGHNVCVCIDTSMVPQVLLTMSFRRWANQICADDHQERAVVLASMKWVQYVSSIQNHCLIVLPVCGTMWSTLGGR